jgi:hypothetical protein
VKEGFEEPVMKGRTAALFADWNWDKAADTLGRLHAVYAGKAASIVTAHDARTWAGIPACPMVAKSN